MSAPQPLWIPTEDMQPGITTIPTNRTVTTAAELDALPAGSVVLDRWGCAWQKGRESLWHSAGDYVRTTAARVPLLVLYDPSAPAPAPSVVPEAAVEAGVEAARQRLTWPSLHWGECRIDPDAWPHIVRAALTAALPLLTAAPSATREDVIRVVAKADGQNLDGYTTHTAEMQYGDLATALLARFNITPKEDR